LPCGIEDILGVNAGGVATSSAAKGVSSSRIVELVIVVQAAVASRKRVRWMWSEGVEGFSG
jgi:hypothetical protein